MQNRVATISKYEMIKFDEITSESKTEHNPNWSTPGHPYRILIIGGSGSRKTKRVIKFNELPIRYWLNIPIYEKVTI